MIKNYLKKSAFIYWLAFVLGLLSLIFIQYFGLFYYHYPVPPGDDAFIHWQTIKPLLSGISLLDFIRQSNYPPLYHISTFELAKFFHIDSLILMKLTAPSIIIFGALSTFLFTYKAFGRWTALLAFYIYSFSCRTIIEQLNDGGYPNLIASQVFVPLIMLFAVELLTAKKIWQKISSGSILLLLLIIIALMHNFTFLYIIFWIILTAILILAIKAYLRKWPIIKILIASMIILLFSTLVILLIFYSDILPQIKNFFNSYFQILSHYPFVRPLNHYPEMILSLSDYPHYIGQGIFVFGVLAVIILPFFKLDKKYFWGYITLSSLALILLFCSRLDVFPNPDRFLRDTSFPLSILGGLFIISLWNRFGSGLARITLVVIAAALFLDPTGSRFIKSLKYEPMVRITDADVKEINYLKNQNMPGGNILIEGYSFYFTYFLPDWNVEYLWVPGIDQFASAHPLNPQNPLELKKLMSYDYLYIVDNQKGWVPKAVQSEMLNIYKEDKNFEFIDCAISKTNKACLFKVRRDLNESTI